MRWPLVARVSSPVVCDHGGVARKIASVLSRRIGRHLLHHGQHQLAVAVIQAHGVAADLAEEADWRTGANEATTFVTTGDLVTNRTKVPNDSYTIFTVPKTDQWTLIINKHTGESGTPYKYESEELARVPMSVTKLSSPVENFTISFDHTGGSCMMRMAWENTQASVEFTEKNADMPMQP